MSTTTENKERVICQGFQVLRLKERITELELTFGFYDYDKLKELEDEVIALQGYTPSMEKRLEELEERVIQTIENMRKNVPMTVGAVPITQDIKNEWIMDPNMPLPTPVGVDRSDDDKSDFIRFTSTFMDKSGSLCEAFKKCTISTQITAEMFKSFKGPLFDVVEDMNKRELLKHMPIDLREKPSIRGYALEYGMMDGIIIEHTPIIGP